jgi:hypothetical protein
MRENERSTATVYKGRLFLKRMGVVIRNIVTCGEYWAVTGMGTNI